MTEDTLTKMKELHADSNYQKAVKDTIAEALGQPIKFVDRNGNDVPLESVELPSSSVKWLFNHTGVSYKEMPKN